MSEQKRPWKDEILATLELQSHHILNSIKVTLPVALYFFAYLSPTIFFMDHPDSVPLTQNDHRIIYGTRSAQAFLVSLWAYAIMYFACYLIFGPYRLRLALKYVVLPITMLTVVYWSLMTITGIDSFAISFFTYIMGFIEAFLLIRMARRHDPTDPDPDSVLICGDGTPTVILRSIITMILVLAIIQNIIIGVYYSSPFLVRMCIRGLMYPAVFNLIIFMYHHAIRRFSIELLHRRRVIAVWIFTLTSFMGRVLTVNAGSYSQVLQISVLIASIKFISRSTVIIQYQALKYVHRQWKSLAMLEKTDSVTRLDVITNSNESTHHEQPKKSTQEYSSSSEENQQRRYTQGHHIKVYQAEEEKPFDSMGELSLHVVPRDNATEHPEHTSIEMKYKKQVVAQPSNDDSLPNTRHGAGEASTPSVLDIERGVHQRLDDPHNPTSAQGQSTSGSKEAGQAHWTRDVRLLKLRQLQIYDEIRSDYYTIIIMPIFLYIMKNAQCSFKFTVVDSPLSVMVNVGIQLGVELASDFFATIAEVRYVGLDYDLVRKNRPRKLYYFDVVASIFSLHLLLAFYMTDKSP